jgi:hypothetical protein
VAAQDRDERRLVVPVGEPLEQVPVRELPRALVFDHAAEHM